MPFLEQDIVKYFEREIKASAKEHIEELQKEIEEIKTSQLQKIENQVRETVDSVVEVELNEMNLEFSAKTNRLTTVAHQAVIKKKHELLDTILLEVRDKFLSFVTTKDYENSMKRLVTIIDEDFCGDQFVFKIKTGDQILKDIIQDNFTKKIKIEEDESIKIGGFIGVCTKKGILTDQTIDNRLEEARVKLYEKSSLALK